MKNKPFLIGIIFSVIFCIVYLLLKIYFGFQFPLSNVICIILSLYGIYQMIISIKSFEHDEFIVGDIVAFKGMEKIEYVDNDTYYNFFINIRFYYNNEEIVVNRKIGRMTKPRIGEQIRLKINKSDLKLSEINDEYKIAYYIGIVIFVIAIIMLIIDPVFNLSKYYE